MENGIARSPHGPALPRAIIVLGLVSLLMDVSSEMIHALLPVFIVGTLGGSALIVGWVDGLGEATAQIVKLFSGVWSDRMRRRKPLALLGYGLGALSKPAFALANSIGVVVAARVSDRLGKGIRSAPRDALIADVTAPAQRGAAYGLRQTLDSIGGFVGPLLAIGLMWLWQDDIRAVFAVAVIPAALSVLVLWRGLQEPRIEHLESTPATPRWWHGVAELPAEVWQLTALAAVLTMARFSEAFLILRAQANGLPLTLTPMVLVLMNLVYAGAAYPLGAWADRASKRRLLGYGIVPLLVADLLLAASASLTVTAFGVALWGLHLAATQGLLAAMLSARAPSALRGTAFGVFNLVCGLTLLPANLLAGALWDGFGAGLTFYCGAGFALSALAMLAFPAFERD